MSSVRTQLARLASLAQQVGYSELLLLLLIGAVAGGIWVFAEVADEILEGDTRETDRRILLAMRSADDPSDPIGPQWVEELGRDLTALGGLGILALITLAAVGFLYLQSKGRTALFVLLAVGSGWLTSTLLKRGFDRPRPDLVPHEAEVYTSSFPSGHSMMSAVAYLTLGALLARSQAGRRLKIYLMSLAILLTLIVGVSRVYLGVHWPTDVVAGWTAGATWAMIWWLISFWLQRQGGVENPEP